MREAWLVELRRVLFLVAFGSLLAWATGAPAVVVAALAIGFSAWHLHQLHLLAKRVMEPSLPLADVPAGVWGELQARLVEMHGRSKRRKKRLGKEIARFRQATEASPDAAVVLRDGEEIAWLNRAACEMLGLRRPDDVGQPITNLLRAPAFVEYVEAGVFDEPLELRSPVVEGVQISVRVVPYGKNRRLLLARDVTRVHRLEQVRTDFVANVSHELRSPLTVVLGYLETLAGDDAAPEGWRRPVEQMLQQAMRMRSLVEDLLRLSRLEVETEPAVGDAVSVTGLVETLQAESLLLSSEPREIVADVDGDPTLSGDYGELYSAFSNLVFNAVRYTPAGGRIAIRWRSLEDGGGAFEVADTGVGIEAHHLPRLTERFYRADKARSRELAGTGLGLAIVKHVLARHGATLHVESTVGEGSLFSCRFPAERLTEVEPGGPLPVEETPA